MVELEQVLLRPVTPPSFGHAPKDIALLWKDQSMSTQSKVILNLAGDRLVLEGASVNISWENGNCEITINTPSAPSIPVEESPIAQGIVATEESEFQLSGEALETFIISSDLRKAENIVGPADRSKESPTRKVLQTEFYDIMNMDGVQNAMMELSNLESALVSEGFRAITTTTPRFKYDILDTGEIGEMFQLTEEVVVLKCA